MEFWCTINADKLLQDFNETYNMRLKEISDGQYFKLAFIATNLLADNNHLQCETIEDYKKCILHFLITGYIDLNNENYEMFYNPDKALDLYYAVREIFAEEIASVPLGER